MMFDVIRCSLSAPNRLVPVKELLGRSEGSRMPQVNPSLLTRKAAELASKACPTGALTLIQQQDRELLRLDYGKCIGCGRCMNIAQPSISPAERLACCGGLKRQLVRH